MGMEKRLDEVMKGLMFDVVRLKSMLFDVDFAKKEGWLVGWK